MTRVDGYVRTPNVERRTSTVGPDLRARPHVERCGLPSVESRVPDPESRSAIRDPRSAIGARRHGRLASRRWGALLVVALLTMAGCGGRDAKPASAITIGFVPKGSTHEHWKRVRIGAEKAAAEFTAAGTRVNVIWKGADA